MHPVFEQQLEPGPGRRHLFRGQPLAEVGDLVAGCRKLNMVIVARTDPHAVHQDVYDAHPDWIAVEADGKPFKFNQAWADFEQGNEPLFKITQSFDGILDSGWASGQRRAYGRTTLRVAITRSIQARSTMNAADPRSSVVAVFARALTARTAPSSSAMASCPSVCPSGISRTPAVTKLAI